jgi:hypothetical protein
MIQGVTGTGQVTWFGGPPPVPDFAMQSVSPIRDSRFAVSRFAGRGSRVVGPGSRVVNRHERRLDAALFNRGRGSQTITKATHRIKDLTGDPDPKPISTSCVERQNLTMRMSMRRFTRLTNAFSKRVKNHAAAVALYFMYYNFGRVHQTLRVTPAMEAGVTGHVWSVEEIVGLLG